MALAGIPRYLVIDDFLSPEMAGELLAHAIGSEADFRPTEIMRPTEGYVNPDFRQSLICDSGLGPLKQPFRAALQSRSDEFLAAVGIPRFDIAKIEVQLIAHGDNHFYNAHIDTHRGPGHVIERDYRVLTCVYYFHRHPKGFSGGELALHALGDSDEIALVEPVDNRLVVFPSFVRHEVRRTQCPSRAFGDSRFAINCWLRKAKANPVPESSC